MGVLREGHERRLLGLLTELLAMGVSWMMLSVWLVGIGASAVYQRGFREDRPSAYSSVYHPLRSYEDQQRLAEPDQGTLVRRSR